MKEITLSADEHLIDRAREKAPAENQRDADIGKQYDELMERIRKSGAGSGGRKFTREEMNER